MKNTRFAEAQTAAVCKKPGASVTAFELTRRDGIRASMIKLRRDKCGGTKADDFARLRQLPARVHKGRVSGLLTMQARRHSVGCKGV